MSLHFPAATSVMSTHAHADEARVLGCGRKGKLALPAGERRGGHGRLHSPHRHLWHPRPNEAQRLAEETSLRDARAARDRTSGEEPSIQAGGGSALPALSFPPHPSSGSTPSPHRHDQGVSDCRSPPRARPRSSRSPHLGAGHLLTYERRRGRGRRPRRVEASARCAAYAITAVEMRSCRASNPSTNRD